jgi:methylglutaconyl-CoA hydratase
MPSETLLTSLSDRGIATITFNRPDRANSYDAAMLDALVDDFECFGGDPAVRVIVLRGAGKHFSAGAAIGEHAGRSRLSIGQVCDLVDTVVKPTIAVVQGACIGGALALASCCDVIVASRSASFAIPEIRLGFAPNPLLGFFVRAIGYRALRRYLLSGERFSAEEAMRTGLVNQLCDDEATEQVLDQLIEQFLLGAPAAIAQAKRALRTQAVPAALSPEEMRDLQAVFDSVSNSEEAVEGRASFKEKRKPRWYPPRREV